MVSFRRHRNGKTFPIKSKLTTDEMTQLAQEAGDRAATASMRLDGREVFNEHDVSVGKKAFNDEYGRLMNKYQPSRLFRPGSTAEEAAHFLHLRRGPIEAREEMLQRMGLTETLGSGVPKAQQPSKKEFEKVVREARESGEPSEDE